MENSIISPRLRFATAVARMASWIVRTLNIGEGAALPGRVLLRIYPDAIKDLSRSLPTVLISGTNAKTTTTALCKEALSGSFSIVSNVTGANMEEGVAFSLASRDFSTGSKSLGVFEVDEAYLAVIGARMETRIIALLNLSRDQLDRVSETRMTSGKWRTFIGASPNIKVVANCDDPLVVYAAQVASEVLWVSAGLNFRQDARSCPVCGGEIEFLDSGWRCSCGFARPAPDVKVEGKKVIFGGKTINVDLLLPGQCNVANAAVALGISGLLNVDLDSAARRMSQMTEVAGRYKRVSIGGHSVRLLLSKNPAGWLEVFDMVGDDPSVVVGINSQIADGRDPSWLWDVPFEALRGKEVVAAGERAYDLSVRLHYADVAHRVMKDPLKAIVACHGDEVTFVGNYTSFQDLRKALGGSGSTTLNSVRRFGERIFR